MPETKDKGVGSTITVCIVSNNISNYYLIEFFNNNFV